MMQQANHTVTEGQAKVLHAALVALRAAESAIIDALADKDPAANFTPSESAWVEAFRKQALIERI